MSGLTLTVLANLQHSFRNQLSIFTDIRSTRHGDERIVPAA